MVIDFNMPYVFPRHLERLFDEVFRPTQFSGGRTQYPLLNVSEDADNIYVRSEIPGVPMDKLELTLTEKTLVIKGERPVPQGRAIRQERPVGAFQRMVHLNVPVDREGVKAQLTDGVLTVTLPRAEEVKPRKIEIELA